MNLPDIPKEFKNCILGLDPGRSGGIAIVSKKGKAMAWGMSKMSRQDIADLLRCLGRLEPTAFLEKVASRPSQASQAVFTFGRMYERLYMGTACFNIPCNLVSPKEWQEATGCEKAPKDKSLKAHVRKRIHKNNLKKKAVEIFPSMKITLQTADALLIGEFGRRKYIETFSGST
jgi:hypothetical protein